MEASQVSQTIADQIGRRAFVMMGATNLVGSKMALQFKVGSNAKGVTHIRVELTPMDTYTVTFYRVRGIKTAQLAQLEDVYADSLQDVIEMNTGLYLSL